MGSILYAHLYVELDNLDQSKQGRPPRNSEKGAVRCCRRTMRGYNSGLYYVGFTTAPLFASFFDPSMEDLLQRHFLLLFGP